MFDFLAVQRHRVANNFKGPISLVEIGPLGRIAPAAPPELRSGIQ